MGSPPNNLPFSEEKKKKSKRLPRKGGLPTPGPPGGNGGRKRRRRVGFTELTQQQEFDLCRLSLVGLHQITLQLAVGSGRRGILRRPGAAADPHGEGEEPKFCPKSGFGNSETAVELPEPKLRTKHALARGHEARLPRRAFLAAWPGYP